MRDFRQLKVWEKAHRLALDIYKATASFPKDELYGLTSQIRRASVSIPANLAEGCGRHTEAELTHFSQISMGSASELEYHLLLAYDLGYLAETDFQNLNSNLVEVRRMLNTFLQRLREG